jgi:hypothetical protein
MWEAACRRLLPTGGEITRVDVVPLGPRTVRLYLTGSGPASLIGKRGSAREALHLRNRALGGLAPLLLGTEALDSDRALLLMADMAGAPPAWTDPAALTAAFATLGALHRRTLRSSGRVICHGDLHRENLLWDGARCWLLDWEHGHLGDPLTDLADLWPWGAGGPRGAPAETPNLGLLHRPNLPTGEAALYALRAYHRAGPLAGWPWGRFRESHRQAVIQRLTADHARHQARLTALPPGGERDWISLQAHALRLLLSACHW